MRVASGYRLSAVFPGITYKPAEPLRRRDKSNHDFHAMLRRAR
jgi:hypothetical protein